VRRYDNRAPAELVKVLAQKAGAMDACQIAWWEMWSDQRYGSFGSIHNIASYTS
jgi:hypothetical protein